MFSISLPFLLYLKANLKKIDLNFSQMVFNFFLFRSEKCQYKYETNQH